MLWKYTLGGVAGLMWIGTASFAAESSTGSAEVLAATSSSSSEVPFEHNWRASKMVGLVVYDGHNENVGSINDLLMDNKGSVKVVVISIEGFLSINARLVAVSFDKIRFAEQPVRTGRSGAPTSEDSAPQMPPTKTIGTTSTPVAITEPNPWFPNHAIFNGTKDELKNLSEFKY
ncbi:PRC-barrel domain-containing protein [Bradyrhizobium sp. 197]|uniref:PRC-barrel domain-containing protein n=1 Tax=Bradyrhizobium sp. 197 TaxID=2782663 RepID=UPI001FFA3D59|nr:PRC-barrel domain-containing protein [Bradyrhizobium sp. 197]MCK1477004.1 PRC-barrel domain-containing protein [Bradyrhizobium sp. 197]